MTIPSSLIQLGKKRDDLFLTKMKPVSVFRLALFYLLLLTSHECITVAHNIRHRVQVRKHLDTMVNLVKDIDWETNLVELESKHGMSQEAFRTMEMAEMYKSLKAGT